MNYTSAIIIIELQEYYVHRMKSSLYTTTAINWPITSSNRRNRNGNSLNAFYRFRFTKFLLNMYIHVRAPEISIQFLDELQ